MFANSGTVTEVDYGRIISHPLNIGKPTVISYHLSMNYVHGGNSLYIIYTITVKSFVESISKDRFDCPRDSQ